MRFLVATITLITLTQPALALTNGRLFEQCKPYANNGFSFEGFNQNQITNALACSWFHSGVLHHAQLVCSLSISVEDKQNFGTSIKDPKVAIQKFINWAEANPKWWGEPPAPIFWLQDTCKE